MAELLSSGAPERGPRRPWRWAAGVLAATFVVGVALARGNEPGGKPVPAPEPTTPAASQYVAGDERAEDLPGRLVGLAAPPPPDVRLLVGGTHPTAIGASDVVLDRLRLHDEAVGALVPVRGGVVARIDPHRFTAPSANSRVVFVHGDRVTPLGRADDVIAGRRGDRVYLQSYGPHEAAPGTLTERDLDGRVLARRAVRQPMWVQADTDAGLLVHVLARRPGDAETVALADPRTLRVRRDLGPAGYVVATRGQLAAWVLPACCGLRIADLATGRTRTVSRARDFVVGTAAFSPDRRRLAVAYLGRHPQQLGGAAPGFVEVLDLASGRHTRVPGVETAIKQYADLSWTPDGRWLALGVGLVNADMRRIGVWPATGGRVRLLRTLAGGGYQPSALLAIEQAS